MFKRSLIGWILLVVLFAAGARAEDFSIVALPDPQHYASKYTEIGLAQTQWIKDNVEKLQIKFVTSMGDNVDHGYIDAEFKNSESFYHKLDEVVPFGVAPGNHDHLDGKKGSYTSRKFVEHFGPQRFKNYAWYGGASESGFSSWQQFSASGKKFIAIQLDVDALKPDIDWAKKVLADHPGVPVILTTHQLVGVDGKFGKGLAVHAAERQGPAAIWEQLIKPSPQIFLALCGHYHGEAQLVQKNDAGQPVQMILQDYQDDKNGGNGWLRIFTFRPEKNKVDVQTYSPSLKEYKKSPKSEFSFDIDWQHLGEAPKP